MNRADHVDYVPTIFVHTNAVTPLNVDEIEEHEKRVLRRRMRQRNDQDIGLTKKRRTAHGKVVLSGDRADENDNKEAASQEVENSTFRLISSNTSPIQITPIYL